MNDMLSALRNAGVVSEKTLREAEAQQLLDAEEASGHLRRDTGERERRLEILRTTNSVPTFRLEAHKLLLAFPELTSDVVGLAHERKMKEKMNGGKRLIANLLELRNTLRHVRDEDKADYVKRILPKK